MEKLQSKRQTVALSEQAQRTQEKKAKKINKAHLINKMPYSICITNFKSDNFD